MYRVNNILLILIFVYPIITLSQNNNEKENVYLLFDLNTKRKCIIEDGSGNSVKNNKYRKEIQGNYIYFKICDEKFSTHKFKSFKDTCHIRALDNLKIVDLKYINEKKSQSILKYNPFEKIYIIEKISETKVIKYEVIWVDDWLEVDD
ncbi:hypothetical protein [Polaribacter ponticola]|uniref:Uncharacterized protein n=1 Tax=Polaribacter ponticola TaxID=2978475 RepID=A0ABT5SAY3_9FLAO|nr:hypothetical protein [Polaribacter sp. MSW5]MDD7915281.1 hypothetical protein [Polaribacter sp. MSW5]